MPATCVMDSLTHQWMCGLPCPPWATALPQPAAAPPGTHPPGPPLAHVALHEQRGLACAEAARRALAWQLHLSAPVLCSVLRATRCGHLVFLRVAHGPTTTTAVIRPGTEDFLAKLSNRDRANCPLAPSLAWAGASATCTRTGLRYWECCGRKEEEGQAATAAPRWLRCGWTGWGAGPMGSPAAPARSGRWRRHCKASHSLLASAGRHGCAPAWACAPGRAP